MKVSVYIVIEMYKGERSPLLRIDSCAYWDKSLADNYTAGLLYKKSKSWVSLPYAFRMPDLSSPELSYFF